MNEKIIALGVMAEKVVLLKRERDECLNKAEIYTLVSQREMAKTSAEYYVKKIKILESAMELLV